MATNWFVNGAAAGKSAGAYRQITALDFARLHGRRQSRVRFQGARTSASLDDPCSLELSGPSSPLEAGSLTPWVVHPEELNAYNSNIVRFVVYFDASLAPATGLLGVTDLYIKASPE